jgi:hypothetical protein
MAFPGDPAVEWARAEEEDVTIPRRHTRLDLLGHRFGNLVGIRGARGHLGRLVSEQLPLDQVIGKVHRGPHGEDSGTEQ